MKSLFTEVRRRILHEAALPIMHVKDYVRMVGPGSRVEFWVVERGDLHHVLKLEKTGSLGVDVVGSGDLKTCRRIYSLEVENALKATTLYDVGREVETRKLDAEGAKRLKVFNSPMFNIDWAHTPEETTASDQFVALLRRQVQDWKGASNSLNVARHREWPAFHARVVEAVKSKYGSQVILYRGIKGSLAKKVLDGGPLDMRLYTSWTPKFSAAQQYRGAKGVVVKAAFKASSIALAPVRLPDFADPGILEPLAHDVQHVGEELIVVWKGKSLPVGRFKVATRPKG